MKKGTIILIIVAVIILIAAFTNPGIDKHKQAVEAALTEYIQQNAPQKQSGLALNFGELMVDRTVNSLISRDNYFLFSTTKITWEGQTHTIGLGIFGHVFLAKGITGTLTGNPAAR